MAQVPRKLDVKHAPKLIKKSLQTFAKVLVFTGKPLYLTLTFILIFFLNVAYITGYLSRLTLTRAFQLLRALIVKSVTLKVRPPRLKIPSQYIPKTAIIKALIPSYQIKSILKLLGLRVKLILFRFLRIKPKVKLAKIRVRYFIVLLVLALFIFLPIFSWELIFADLPSPHELLTRKQDVSTKIYDRNGVLLYKIYKDQNRTPVPLSQIPLQVRLATLAIEDAEFYSHPGFSLRGITRAIIKNIGKGELTGGSTITQQLVKNALLTPEKTLVRKLREIALAVGVELKFGKDEILEMYLNEVAYGGTAYGIQEAAQVYFDKDVGQLTLAESALLAGLPKSPTRFSPFGPDPQFAFARQKEVLKLMQINGFITKEERERAENEKITFAPNQTNILAPHFVMYVRGLLEEKYGKEVVEKGGLEVVTTLDYRIQKLTEEVVKRQVGKLAKLNVGNGAAIVVDTSSGEILAMVGSRDYFDTTHDGNVNVTTRPRQPGSSIKVVNYAYALSNGYTPATILSDTPITFQVAGQPPYSPKNYDGTFRGKLTLRSALAESRNVPAVKVLASYGVDKMLETGQELGIVSWSQPSNYGLSLTLGGGEVTLLDLARVYGTIANYGKKLNLVSILKATNYKGVALEENECLPPEEKSGFKVAEALEKEGQKGVARAYEAESDLAKTPKTSGCEEKQVLDAGVAFILIDILRDNYARAPAFGSNSLLSIPGHAEVAVKTGTSNDLRDNLAIGFNQKYLVAAWVGNNDNSPMSRIASGITGATPIFNEIMSALLAKEENHPWQVPDSLVQLSICPFTGTLACSGCPTRTEFFLEENQPKNACDPGWFKKEDEKASGPGGEEILEPESQIEIIDLKKLRKPRPRLP